MGETVRAFVAVTFSPQSSVAYFLKGVLDCAGFDVCAAVSTPEELEASVGRDRPDAIVYDVSFPFASNWQKLQDVRRRPALQNIPVVVTTSEPRELFRATGCSSAVEVFSRPDDVRHFRDILQSAIESVAPVQSPA
jgi:CheY-like chemotaxis protein